MLSSNSSPPLASASLLQELADKWCDKFIRLWFCPCNVTVAAFHCRPMRGYPYLDLSRLGMDFFNKEFICLLWSNFPWSGHKMQNTQKCISIADYQHMLSVSDVTGVGADAIMCWWTNPTGTLPSWHWYSAEVPRGLGAVSPKPWTKTKHIRDALCSSGWPNIYFL